MKITTWILIVALLMVSLLTSCGLEPSADELAFRILNLYDSLPPCSQYVKDGELYTAGYLSPEQFAYLYTGERFKLPEWDMIEELRLVLSDTTTPFELHIIKLKTASDSDEIAKLLQRRADLLTYHNKTEEDFHTDEPLVLVHGRYVFLLVTYDNAAAELLIKQIL